MLSLIKPFEIMNKSMLVLFQRKIIHIFVIDIWIQKDIASSFHTPCMYYDSKTCYLDIIMIETEMYNDWVIKNPFYLIFQFHIWNINQIYNIVVWYANDLKLYFIDTMQLTS